MFETVFPYLFGVILAVLTVKPSRRFGVRAELEFLRLVMVGVAVVFVVFPASSGDWAGVRHELAALAVFVVLLLATRWNMAVLALTYFVHGLWDLLFIVGRVAIDKPGWLSELCVPYDWLIALYVLYLMQRREPLTARTG